MWNQVSRFQPVTIIHCCVLACPIFTLTIHVYLQVNQVKVRHFPHGNCVQLHWHTKIIATRCSYTMDVYKMYTTCIQNLYHISINLCIHFVYKIKRTIPPKFCVRKCMQKFVEISYTFCIQIFCIHFVCKSLSKCEIYFVYKYFVASYTFCIHFAYKMCNYKSLSKSRTHFLYKHFAASILHTYINSYGTLLRTLLLSFHL